MLTAACVLDRTRPILKALVDRERIRTGSKMTAYARVASKIGVTASWVRELIGRRHLVLEAHEYLNIHAAYVAMCERVEREIQHERDQRALLKETAHAALEGFDGAVPGASPHRSPAEDRPHDWSVGS